MVSCAHLRIRGPLHGHPERNQVRLPLRHRTDQPPRCPLRRPRRSLLHGRQARPPPRRRQHHVCKEHVAVDFTAAIA